MLCIYHDKKLTDCAHDFYTQMCTLFKCLQINVHGICIHSD